jgi:hypothetical protein
MAVTSMHIWWQLWSRPWPRHVLHSRHNYTSILAAGRSRSLARCVRACSDSAGSSNHHNHLPLTALAPFCP